MTEQMVMLGRIVIPSDNTPPRLIPLSTQLPYSTLVIDTKMKYGKQMSKAQGM